jgi:hypothetical protein
LVQTVAEWRSATLSCRKKMVELPFRTSKTWLTDEQLILLDVLFQGGASFDLLRDEGFREQFNLPYSHNLNDGQLQCQLRWLCERGVLEAKRDHDRIVFHVTAAGGALWSQERCPVWERYCIETYKTTSRGRTMMTVLAVSPRVRDDFLTRWPLDPARRRSITMKDQGLIGWHRFGQLFVGVATYEEPRRWTPEEYAIWVERHQRHQAMLERERSWWRFVEELQRFVPKDEPGAAADRPRD